MIKASGSFVGLRPETVLERLLAKSLPLLLAALFVALSSSWAVDPLGPTLHADGTTTFRLWAPFVDSVAVSINGGAPVPLAPEPGHPDADDATWTVTVPGTKAGDQFVYAIGLGGTTRNFVDPRSQQVTGFDAPGGFGIPGSTAQPQSVIVDSTFDMPAFTEPTFNSMVIYELHVGTFNNNFAGVIAQLDYLQGLGINAIELLPVNQNPLFPDHTPVDHDWGYDPAQLFAVKSKYGAPQDLKELVKQCHQRQIAVIQDVVYNHFVSNNLLQAFGGFAPSTVPNGIFFYGDARAQMGDGPRPDYGRPQVRQYITDNALMLLRDYGMDGLRFDDTIDLRTYQNHTLPIPDGATMLQGINSAFRNTDPQQPGKITIAEDLQGDATVTNRTDPNGLGFNSQWDDSMVNILRNVMTAISDQNRDLGSVKFALQNKIGGDVFGRVIYSEDHDQVGHPPGQSRLPAMIDTNNPESIFAKKRSTLAAAIVLTSPGIPMLFQGQEMLETRAFGFTTPTNMNFARAVDPNFKGIVQMYRDLIALRRNLANHTAGLTGQNLNVFHLDAGNQTLAYHRWANGGAGDDVVVVANFSNTPLPSLNIGFPRGGLWSVRFNSGANVYDPSFVNGDSFDTTANPGGQDNLNFNANVGIGPYSAVIFSQ